MVNNRMVVCANNDGGLLVRVAPADHERCLTWNGARQAEMGKGRSMGTGWIAVSVDAVQEDEQLDRWVQLALDHNREATQ